MWCQTTSMVEGVSTQPQAVSSVESIQGEPMSWGRPWGITGCHGQALPCCGEVRHFLWGVNNSAVLTWMVDVHVPCVHVPSYRRPWSFGRHRLSCVVVPVSCAVVAFQDCPAQRGTRTLAQTCSWLPEFAAGTTKACVAYRHMCLLVHAMFLCLPGCVYVLVVCVYSCRPQAATGRQAMVW